MLFSHKCPSCLSPNKQELCTYTTKNHGTRKIFQCIDCNCAFSETKGTILENIKHPISKIWKAIDMRTEGMGFNATARSCGISKNTLIDWENKFTPLCKTLYLYSLCHCFMQVVIEGDEFYTKINKNVPADESSGWTIVLMDRASRFIWQMNCGKKDRDLFEKTIKELEEIVNQTNDLSLITDGERRYGNILFEICNELIKTGKPGRPRRTLKKGVKVRVKNKGSQNHKKGRKRPKYQAPHPEHPQTEQNIEFKDIHANHVEANNSAMRRKCSPYRRRTNTYAKSENGLQRVLNVYWVIHNFIRKHFTIKKIPAVALGIVKNDFSLNDLFSIQMI